MSIMLPPESGENNRGPGWSARNLTPQDVAPLLDSFITKFAPGPPGECWPWRGRQRPNGYGLLDSYGQNALLAHRVSWVAFTGKPLVNNLTIDHLCNNPPCVNPDHLEPVTFAENIRRAHERAGNVIGGKPRVRTSTRPYVPRASPRRPPRPLEPGETPAERQRKNASAYYWANREKILEKRRREPLPKITCAQCGREVVRNYIRLHERRRHSGAA